MGDDSIDPATRYKLFGYFDVGAYSSDLDEFPDCFDEIAAGEAQPPEGFSQEWFQDACGKSSDQTRFVRDFPEALKKLGSKDYKERLLRSAPGEDPEIPPIPTLHLT